MEKAQRKVVITMGDTSDADGLLAVAQYAREGLDVVFVMPYPAYLRDDWSTLEVPLLDTLVETVKSANPIASNGTSSSSRKTRSNVLLPPGEGFKYGVRLLESLYSDQYISILQRNQVPIQQEDLAVCHEFRNRVVTNGKFAADPAATKHVLSVLIFNLVCYVLYFLHSGVSYSPF